MIYLTGVTKDLFLRKRMIQLIQMEACVYMRQILQSARMDVTISIIIWIKRRLFQLRLLIHQLAHSNFTAMSKIKTVIVLEKDRLIIRSFSKTITVFILAHSNFTAMSKIKTVIVLEKDLMMSRNLTQVF